MDFELLEPLRAPSFVHLRLSHFWQSSRSLWRSQPSYFKCGFRCNGTRRYPQRKHTLLTALTHAGEFCAMRPSLRPPYLGQNRTLCDLPPKTEVTPCGRYTALINLDEMTLVHLRPPNETAEGSSSRHAPTLLHVPRSRVRILRREVLAPSVPEPAPALHTEAPPPRRRHMEHGANMRTAVGPPHPKKASASGMHGARRLSARGFRRRVLSQSIGGVRGRRSRCGGDSA